jgi:hypothetical protein
MSASDRVLVEKDTTFSTLGPTCPHCGYCIRPDEAHHYDPNLFTETECSDCGKPFKVEVFTSTSWTCRRFGEPKE